MLKIALIGAGGIGSRHLQGLALLKVPTQIYVIDVNQESLRVAKERVEAIQNFAIHDIIYSQKIEDIPQAIEIAIVATGAAVRRMIIEKLISLATIKYLILEKVLFQTIDEYQYVYELLEKHNIKAWVNCPQRLYCGNKKIKEVIGNDFIREYSLIGSNWGLGCNAVHYIDEVAFFTENYDFQFDSKYLEPKLYDSKRQNYKEFFGTLMGKSSKCNSIILTSFNSGQVPAMVRIITDNARIEVYHNEQKMIISMGAKNWIQESFPFEIRYQSGLTNIYVEELEKTGSCSLPTLFESSKIHVALIEELLNLQNIIGEDKKTCPIT